MPDSKNILIIDDSNTNVILLEAVLDSKGFTTQTALSVKEALPLIEKKKPSLILLDLLMPEISGFDFLKQLRNNEKMKSIPVVVVSALSDEANIEKTRELGAVEYIKKPINIDGLVEVVGKLVK